MPPRRRTEEEDLAAFRKGLHDVGENLPDEMPGIEGSDVGTVTRRKSSEAERIARELEESHEDTENELVDEMDL